MPIKEWFAILPYLKTSDTIQIRGVQFRSSDNLEGLPEESQNHLKTLFSLFFLKDNLRISKMSYIRIELNDNAEKSQSIFRQLREARILIAYLYCSPDRNGRAFLSLEHSDLYLFTPEQVSKHIVRPEHGVEDISSVPQADSDDDMVLGYEGYRNFNSSLWVVNDSRIYPPTREFWLNISQDLHYDIGLTFSRRQHWALEEMFHERKSTALSDRIFTSIEWYNRSSSINIGEDVALLHLAIALESLLQLDPSGKITERFKETILTVLGNVPRLDSWIDQFYKARSKIVHEGFWPHLKFYAVESENFPKVLTKKYSGVEYRPLTNYGRIIFRLCLNSILSGAKLTESYGLASFFFHNQERLIKICSTISKEEAEKDANKRILLASEEVFNLHEHLWEGDIELESLVGTVKLAIRIYLDTTPPAPSEVITFMNQILLLDATASLHDKFELFKQLVNQIHKWRGIGYLKGGITTTDPFEVVWSLLEFAISPRFMLQAHIG
jgi:hypothetical protein